MNHLPIFSCHILFCFGKQKLSEFFFWIGKQKQGELDKNCWSVLSLSDNIKAVLHPTLHTAKFI
jgi:hypothetical protein